MSYKVTGAIDEVKEPVTFPTRKGSTFTKQEVIVRVPGQKKSDYLPIELTGDKVGTISTSDVGREVEMRFFLNGRKWEKDGREGCIASLAYAGHDFLTGGAGDELPGTEQDDLNF